MFKQDELFIAGTFKRKCREMFGVETVESETIFERCLKSKIINYVRDVGMPPGTAAYIAMPGFITIEKPQK